MTLRLDGGDKNIGLVTYNTSTGKIKATKGSIGNDVALVVQGNDGTNDWYYSKQITGTEIVDVSAIETETNTPASVNLSACKIWLETTDADGMIYAVNATETAISSISSVEITDIDTPTANTALDTEAVCVTTGVSTTKPSITWSPDDSIAKYDTSYTASVTLTADTFYEFTDNVAATVLGNAATSVTKNQDGTLSVNYEFPAIDKEKHTITAAAGTNGSISPSGAVEVEKGKSQTFTITPAQGYKISSMEVDGVSVSVNSSYTFDNVTQNHTIEVTFTKKSSGIPITPIPTPTPTPTPDPTPEPTPDPIPDNGWYTDEEGNRYFYEEGNLVKNQWYQYEGKWYYLNTDGLMQTGWLKDGDKWYYLNPDGDMKTGWLKDGNKWYYLNPNGDMQTGWLKDGDKWYYLNPNGDMQTGWLKDKDKWYYLNPNGDMKIGWLFYKNDWYYLNPDGDMKAGWLYYKNDWYYLNSDGAMVTDTKVDGYTINHDGIWVK